MYLGVKMSCLLTALLTGTSLCMQPLCFSLYPLLYVGFSVCLGDYSKETACTGTPPVHCTLKGKGSFLVGDNLPVDSGHLCILMGCACHDIIC